MKEFLSTPSARRATFVQLESVDMGRISIHALREEGDVAFMPAGDLPNNFYPRPPRGGRQHPEEHNAQHQAISIHALREEGDLDYR